MTGKHRKPAIRTPLRDGLNKPATRIIAAAVAIPAAAVCVSASTPDAHAANPYIQVHEISDQAPTNPNFLTAVAATGINTTGRETALETIAVTGAESHTTDADLEQSVRALFPDITQVQAQKFVYQVRQTWPGPHEVDTDDDGR